MILLSSCATITTTIRKPTDEVRNSTTRDKSVGIQFRERRMPSVDNPELEIQVLRSIVEEERYQQRYVRRQTLSSAGRVLVWGSGAALAAYGYTLPEEGLVVLGRTLMAAGAGLPVAAELLAYRELGEEWHWETQELPPRIDLAAHERMEVTIFGEHHSIVTDAYGRLQIDISAYADDVPVGQPMLFAISSLENPSNRMSYTVIPSIVNHYRTIDIEKNIPMGRDKREGAVALIIANRHYQNPEVPEVTYAHRDGEFIRQYLVNTLGYREGNVFFYRDATLSNLRTALEELKNAAKRNSDVFVYYTGHGAPDLKEKTGYFVPVDCNPNYVKIGGVALEDFYRELGDIEAGSMTVVIDACFSGASEAGMLIRAASPVFISVEDPAAVLNSGVVLTSSSGDQISSWHPERKHSLYTYYFLKGLQGEADENRDRRLTVGELQTYLEDEVPYMARRLYNREQTPTVTPGREDRVLVRYKE